MNKNNQDMFFLWYQDPLAFLSVEPGCSLVELHMQIPCRQTKVWEDEKLRFSLDWCQNSLDFLYRTIVSGLCDFTFRDETLHPIIDSFAEEGPGTIEGYVTWVTYLLYATDKAKAILEECGVNHKTEETSSLLQTRLTTLFHDCGVGFDKKGFVKMKDYPS